MCVDDEILNDKREPWKDPIVEEVRASGRELWKEAGGTLEGFFEYLRKAEEEHRERVIDKIEAAPEPGPAA